MSKFQADARIQRVAEAYSRDLVTFARRQFFLDLDWTDHSIEALEIVAIALHDGYETLRPTDQKIEPYYRMIGSYIGEVYRRNHGAEWGWVTREGYRFPGMHRKPGTLFWPWARAHNRIVYGASDNLWHYYQYLLTLRTPATQ